MGYSTASRRKIQQYLQDNRNRAVSVQEIHQFLITQDAAVNLSTVYRYLDKLTQEGSVLRFVGETGMAVYQAVDEGRHCREHLHLQCVRCGAVLHLECGFMEEISKHILQDHGFALQCENSRLYGLCRACRTAEKRIAVLPRGHSAGADKD